MYTPLDQFYCCLFHILYPSLGYPLLYPKVLAKKKFIIIDKKNLRTKSIKLVFFFKEDIDEDDTLILYENYHF